jgi:NAD(P)-dependent dehydrogenase (short-subunit alcohol dehydrogenase family)
VKYNLIRDLVNGFIAATQWFMRNSTWRRTRLSKHAIEAFTDSLALQLAPLGVTVNVVEPGNCASYER